MHMNFSETIPAAFTKATGLPWESINHPKFVNLLRIGISADSIVDGILLGGKTGAVIGGIIFWIQFLNKMEAESLIRNQYPEAKGYLKPMRNPMLLPLFATMEGPIVGALTDLFSDDF